MNRQSRRKTSVTRSVLKDIINDPTAPSTMRTNSSLQVLKLNEAVAFLQKKVQRQYTEIKLLSDQLSRQILMKEELGSLLAEQREKHNKTNQLLSSANKTNEMFKKKIGGLQKKEQSLKREEYELKLNKYREIVRKKDELLLKHQQKGEQYIRSEKRCLQLSQQLNQVKQAYKKAKTKENQQGSQLQVLKLKNNQLEKQIAELSKMMQEKQHTLFFAEEKIRRQKEQYLSLSEESKEEMQRAQQQHIQLTKIIEKLKNEVKRLSEKWTQNVPQWSLEIYSNQIKRSLNSIVKDSVLRKKVQKACMQVMDQMGNSFTSILSKIFQR